MAGLVPAIHVFANLKLPRRGCPGMTDIDGLMHYADFSNNSRPISMRRISLVPAPIS
jgi:hypothetical protein